MQIKKHQSARTCTTLTSVSSLMLKLFACFVTFFLASSILARLVVAEDGGLLTIVGNGASCGKEAKAPMLDKAAVMVAAVILAIAAFMVMLDITGNCKDKDVVFWVGKDS